MLTIKFTDDMLDKLNTTSSKKNINNIELITRALGLYLLVDEQLEYEYKGCKLALVKNKTIKCTYNLDN
jgi:hypothetical protein